MRGEQKKIFEQDWTTVEEMHITVSFKDHSSFCTCMLLIKETKKKSWMTERKQGNHHKQTAGQWEGGSECQQSSKKLLCTAACFLSLSPLYTKHGNAWKGCYRWAWQCRWTRATFSHKTSSSVETVSVTLSEIQRRSVLLLSAGRFCFSSCQPWTF